MNRKINTLNKENAASFEQGLMTFAEKCVQSGMGFNQILESYNRAVLNTAHNKQVISRN